MPALIFTDMSIAILAGLWGYQEARRLIARHSALQLESLHKQAGYVYFILILIVLTFLLLAIPMFNRNLMWEVPIWFDLYANDVAFTIVIGCFSFLFTMVATVAWKTSHKEKNGVALASVLLIAIFPMLHFQYTDQAAPELNHLKIEGVILQSHPSTCVAASAANIASVLGIEKTEKEMAIRMRTTKMTGTSAGRAIDGFKQIGITCRKYWVKDGDIAQLSLPAMLFIDNEEIGPESHAVALIQWDGNHAEIWDPLEGKILVTREQIRKFWHGKSLECAPASS